MINTARRQFLRGRVRSAERAGPLSVRLPWTISESHFLDQCSRCGDCLPACTESLISMGDGGYPILDFNQGECTFCQDCVRACKQPLFDLENPPWQNKASVQSHCLALQQVFCQNCKDACEARAIQFRYGLHGIPTPEIQAELCTGCGACIAPCPNDSMQILPLPHGVTT